MLLSITNALSIVQELEGLEDKCLWLSVWGTEWSNVIYLLVFLFDVCFPTKI